jgi:hypothetical protein
VFFTVTKIHSPLFFQLTLHPPVDEKMRRYYLTIFEPPGVNVIKLVFFADVGEVLVL